VSVVHLQSAFASWTRVDRWKHPLSSWATAFQRTRGLVVDRERSAAMGTDGSEPATAFDLERFGSQQVLGLVRQLFLSGWPHPTRQIVFSPIDETTEIVGTCRQIAVALAGEVSADVCLVLARLQDEGRNAGTQRAAPRSKVLHTATGQLSPNLWLVPPDVFAKREQESSAVAGFSRGLEELKREFEYSVIQGPVAGSHRHAVLLGQLCDGVVLVLRANSTRRVAAQKTKELLSAANVQVLGTILCDRTFPIPDSLYQRL
jgi:hypothetical protein